MPQSLLDPSEVSSGPENLLDPADVRSFSASAGTVADRHNNPLNIKYGPLTERYVKNGSAEIGDAGLDGGNFLRFQTPEQGFTAARELLGSSLYKDKTVDEALRKWSNKGYGGEILPALSKTKVSD